MNDQTAELLANLEPLRDTPAARYLVNRKVWPPAEIADLEGDLRPINGPQDVFWNPSKIVFGYRNNDGEMVSLETDRLTPEGTLTVERYRRSWGSRNNTCFTPRKSMTGRWHICEGPIDAVALMWVSRYDGIICIGGTSGRPLLPRADCLIFHSDGDLEGQRAMIKLRDFTKKSVVTEMVFYPENHDPASILADRVIREGWASIINNLPDTYDFRPF